jgi:hypothetical protein
MSAIAILRPLDRCGLLWRQNFVVWRLLHCEVLPQILSSFRQFAL